MPSHLPQDVPPVPFGEVFDLPRLRDELRTHIVEWNEVKSNTSEEYDGLGCWNTWEVSRPEDHKPRWSTVHELLKLGTLLTSNKLEMEIDSSFTSLMLDLSFTKAPDYIRLIRDNVHEIFLSFAGLASLAFPEAKRLHAGDPSESQHLSLKLPIDDQLMCYDYLYYASSVVVSNNLVVLQVTLELNGF